MGAHPDNAPDARTVPVRSGNDKQQEALELPEASPWYQPPRSGTERGPARARGIIDSSFPCHDVDEAATSRGQCADELV